MLYLIKKVYDKFGEGFFNICIMPLIMMIVVQFVITANVILLIAASLSYKYGKKMNLYKQFSYGKLVYNALVPLEVSNHYQSIELFRKIMELEPTGNFEKHQQNDNKKVD